MNGACFTAQVLLAYWFFVAEFAVLRIREQLAFWVVPWNGPDHNNFIYFFPIYPTQLALVSRIIRESRINTGIIKLNSPLALIVAL